MNLLISGAWHQSECYLDDIRKHHNVVYLQNESDNIPCDPTVIEGIICNGLFLYHPIELFKNLHYIQLTSAGYDRVPMDYVKSHNIIIYNARGVYSVPMAEFALSSVLQIYKGTSRFIENQKNHIWNKQRNLGEIAGKNVAIVGCGSVGTECAKRFKAFDANVIGIDILCRFDPFFDEMFELNNLDSVLLSSDIVIVTLPLTNETKYLFSKDRLKNIKNNAILINISRGAVIKTIDLIDELNTNRFYAVLDVFEDEPLDSTSKLWNFDNVIITPHNSFEGEGNGLRISNLIMKNLKDFCCHNSEE